MGCIQYFNYNFSPKVCKMLFLPSELFTVECLILDYWIGPLHHLVTWYKITHSGMQVTQWDFQNKASRTSPTWPAFMLEVPLGNLRPSMWFCTMWLDNAKDLNSMTPQDTLRWFLRNKSYWWIFLKLSLNVLYQALFRKIQ